MTRAIALAVIALCSCSSDNWAASTAIFENPQAYIGKQVTVCGYIHLSGEDTNIWIDKKAQTTGGDGLGLIYYGKSADRLDRRVACVSGELIKTGCKTDKSKICNWSDFDYAIRVR